MSHYFALSKDGVLVPAHDAIGGIDYYCPHCYATLRVRKCIVRLPHFFLFNDTHKTSDCGNLEKEHIALRSPILINPEKFARTIMTPRLPKTDTDKLPDPKKRKDPLSSKEMLPPNSLRQLIVCGVQFMDPSTPIEGGILSDVYIGPKAYGRCFKANENLNFRVIDLWLLNAYNGKIRYIANFTYGGHLYRCIFELHVDASLDFDSLANKLFQTYHVSYGRKIWVKAKYKSVTVAGDWTAVGTQHCQAHCSLCKKSDKSANKERICLGMWTAQLTHLEQLYYTDLPNNRF